VGIHVDVPAPRRVYGSVTLWPSLCCCFAVNLVEPSDRNVWLRGCVRVGLMRQVEFRDFSDVILASIKTQS
jgi:hypothetical protein